MELDSGKYGHILRKQGDVQHKIAMASVALANEDGERNRLLRIQLAMELVNLPDSKKQDIESLIGEELNLEDTAIE